MRGMAKVFFNAETQSFLGMVRGVLSTDFFGGGKAIIATT